MRLKNGLLAVTIALPSLAGVSSAQMHDLDSLRATCMAVQSNSQMKKFDIKLLCGGSYSWWETQNGGYRLPRLSTMYTQASTKCGRFQTVESMFEAELPAHDGVCGVHVKKVMRAPEGVGIPVAISDCSQLTHEYVEALCQDKLHEYCGDQFVEGTSSATTTSATSSSDVAPLADGTSSSSAYGDAMCTVDTVQVVDTCSMY